MLKQHDISRFFPLHHILGTLHTGIVIIRHQRICDKILIKYIRIPVSYTHLMKPDLCAYAMIESAMMQPVKLQSWSAYAGIYANPLARKKWFNKFMYYTVFNDDYAFDDYYRNYQAMTKENLKRILDAVSSFPVSYTHL